MARGRPHPRLSRRGVPDEARARAPRDAAARCFSIPGSHASSSTFHGALYPDGETPAQKIAELKSAFLEQLAAVDNIADDRMARTLLAMVEATVRTNYFCEIPSPDPYIALKFESAKIPNLPDTPPPYEIHVNSPRMEGCHLRAAASPAAASATATVPTITAPKSSTS